MPGMGHPMAFHFGSTEVVLFTFWSTQSWLGILLSCLLIMLGCFVMEFVRWFRLYRKKQQLVAENQGGLTPKTFYMNIAGDGTLHAVQLTLSYMLMLVFMTFNVWLCISVILGEVMARILFGIFFPQLERLNDGLAGTETCCG
uniref:Copper transport protein n=1 Tax=Ditylenchus dipsaci TaxID=166011 RepID=A0A915EHX9_9BILA